MAFLKATVKTGANVIKNLVSGWDMMRKTEVVVGITEDTNAAHDKMSTAALLYLHEHGSPVNNIPPRPVLMPALRQEEVHEKIVKLLKEATVNALIGRKDIAQKDWEKAGMIGMNACKAYIKDGSGLAPNAPITIHGGWMRNKVTGQMIYVKGKGSSKPLIDTGAMLGSITYAVREKRK